MSQRAAAYIQVGISAISAAAAIYGSVSAHYVVAVVNLLLFAINFAGGMLRFHDLHHKKMKENEHGEHRRTAAESDRGPAEAAGPSTGAVATVSAGTHRPDLTLAGAGEDSGVIVGEVLAYRAWMLLGPYIASGMGEIWMPGQPIHGAGCDLTGSAGVHAFKRYEHAAEYFAHYPGSPHYIVGVVRLWGVVVEHRDGYRGEFAMPERFISTSAGDDRLKQCAGLYGAETE